MSTDLYYFFPAKIGDKATTNVGGTATLGNLGINYTYDKNGFPKGQGYYINAAGASIGATILENVSLAKLESCNLPNQSIFNKKFNIEEPLGDILYKTENNIPIFASIYEQLMYNGYGYMGSDTHNLLRYYKTKVNTNSSITSDSNIFQAELNSYLAGNGPLSPSSQEFIDWLVSVSAIQIGAVNKDFEIVKAPEFSSPFAEDDDVKKLNSTDPFFTKNPDDPFRLKKLLDKDDTYFIGLAAGLGDGVIETADLAYKLTKFGVKNTPAVLLVRLITDNDNLIKEKIAEIKVVKDLVSLIFDKVKQDQIYTSIKAATINWFEETTFQKTNVQAGYEQGKILFEILGAFVGITEVKTLLQTGKFSAGALSKIAELKGLFNFGNKLKKIEGVSALVDNAGSVIVKGDKALETFMNVKYMQRGLRPAPNTYMEATHITNHLRKFDGGVVRISRRDKFIQYGTYGDNQAFVMPKNEFEKIWVETGRDIRKVEARLGVNPGEFGDNPAIASFKRSDLGEIKMPSGNEGGANINWIPGGKTSGGTSEAIVDLSNKSIPFDKIN